MRANRGSGRSGPLRRRTARPITYLLTLLSLLAAATAFNAWITKRTSGVPSTGTARVIDGDTFDLCQRGNCARIRLCGINTPEREQPGYEAARAALVEMVRSEDVRCVPVGGGTVCDGRSGASSHERTVAQCGTSSVPDLAGELVRRGHACDLTGFTRGHYRDRYQGRAC
jgi:endonuclease YncB( thermonuclease family)